ncbi:MAG: DedA family protein [Ferruginibacter sp.]
MLDFIILSFNWMQLLQPQFYIEHGGLWLLLFVVFAETGLFAGFFLPGDSLLFVAGIFAHEVKDAATGLTHPGLSYEFLNLIGLGGIRNEWLDLLILIGLVSLAGILGNRLGYWFGKKVGPSIYSWKDTFIFKKRYLQQAHDFYEKHGAIAIVGARFLPLIRTFAPIVAGIVEMDKKKFMYYNILGSIAWVSSMILAGHFLQKWILAQFGFDLKSHLEVIVLGIVLITTAPVLIKLFFGKKKTTTA